MAATTESHNSSQQPRQSGKPLVVVKNTFLELAGEKVPVGSSVRRVCSDPAMYRQENGQCSGKQDHEVDSFQLTGLSDADTDPEGTSQDPAGRSSNSQHQFLAPCACSACSVPWSGSSLTEGLEIPSTSAYDALTIEVHPSIYCKPASHIPARPDMRAVVTQLSIDGCGNLPEEQHQQHQLDDRELGGSSVFRSGLASRKSFVAPGSSRKGPPVGAPASLVGSGVFRSGKQAQQLRSHRQLPSADEQQDFPIGAGTDFPAMLAASSCIGAASNCAYSSCASAAPSKESSWGWATAEEVAASQPSVGSDGISSCSNASNLSNEGRLTERHSQFSSCSRDQPESHPRTAHHSRKARRALQPRPRPLPQTPGLLPQTSSSSKIPLWPIVDGQPHTHLSAGMRFTQQDLGLSQSSASSSREHQPLFSQQENDFVPGGSAFQAPATTLIIRNVPNNYTRRMLMDLLGKQGFSGLYNFLYLPIDFRTRASLGYAFVNMTDSAAVDAFWKHFDGFTRWSLPSKKVCQVGWAGPHQGLQEHIERYRSSPIMHESVPDDFKPILLQDGVRQPFPSPVRPPRAPRIRQKDAADLEVGRGGPADVTDSGEHLSRAKPLIEESGACRDATQVRRSGCDRRSSPQSSQQQRQRQPLLQQKSPKNGLVRL